MTAPKIDLTAHSFVVPYDTGIQIPAVRPEGSPASRLAVQI
ncbi:MAG TPA: hypothetical protein VL380_08960 [Nitrosospira sp.]|nr:hypothetical protein [Nitrosospira sp.]